jgi:hypothetical protein
MFGDQPTGPVPQPGGNDGCGGALEGPPIQTGAVAEDRIVEQDDPTVPGEAAVRLDTIDWPSQGRSKS